MRATQAIFTLAAVTFGLGLCGFTGSSWWQGARFSPLYDEATRQESHELLGLSRGIRSDEWSAEAPGQRSQQDSAPSFPLLNLQQGLGQLQRSPAALPVLDWGIFLRPQLWPLLLGSTWSFGVRWSLRSALVLIALFLWFRSMAASPAAGPDEARRRTTIAALAAVAVAYSSAYTWWLSGGFAETVALGLLAATAGSAALREPRHRKRRWALFLWLCGCTFSSFYPPLWAPLLLVLIASLLDQQLRARPTIPAALKSVVPAIAALALGALTSIFYFATYLAQVKDTLYPGRRVAAAGGLPAGRLLDLVWPALTTYAPFTNVERYLGPEQVNVCEAAAVEALPLFVFLVLAVAPRGRELLRRAVRRSPASFAVWAGLSLWLLAPLPAFVTRALFLQYSPWFRVWFVYGTASALVATLLLAEACAASEGNRPLELAATAIGLGALLALGLYRAPGSGLDLLELANHFAPIGLAFALLLAGIAQLGRPAGAPLLALAWALPLVLANCSVNPVIATRDLFQRGPGHRAIDRAITAEPGRLLDYSTHSALVLAGYGWPVLAGIYYAPDRGLDRFLAAESTDLTPAVYDRFANVSFVSPPAKTRLLHQDDFRIALSPCSPRLRALFVNHLLVPRQAALPDACPAEYTRALAGDLQLWSRRDPACAAGVSPRFSIDALDYDYSCKAGGGALRTEAQRDRVLFTIPPGKAFAFSISTAALAEVTCTGARAALGDAHVFLEAEAGAATPGRCVARARGSLDGLRALAH